ncbi:fluoride efflux transporter CrcB [Devosia sediminis]|uniref:Fluoride-specific ion channel FluC n=1 Tax=Devosia sediminis TaxID=2798801 RepID=A0A934IW22_9HYPH|nr:fluoride efflux transporter CrcB [Devosia sediminis]MBJ3784151.1 fluoride efflux transporter CrcB [Devosia sediminis]
MQALVLVGLGGAIGSMARYGMSVLIGRFWSGSFPLATLLVNITGSMAMGLLIGFLVRTLPASGPDIRLFVGIGVLGGFTTFSSFSLDTISMIERGELGQAALYVGLSVVVCLAGLYCGLLMTRGGMA